MHYKTIEHNMKLIRKHNDIIYIMKQNDIQELNFLTLFFGEELFELIWISVESAGFKDEDELYSLWKL